MPKSEGQPTEQPVLELRVELDEVRPAVWRQLVVPASIRLSKLADILLVSMGWNNSHLHQFRIGDALYGMHADDWPEEELDEAKSTVIQAVGDEHTFWFDYDYGDGWVHNVDVGSARWLSDSLKFAVCTAGANACPPDDVGGPGGYDAFLIALDDAKHPEHERFPTWIGGSFDRTYFDAAETNAKLQRLR